MLQQIAFNHIAEIGFKDFMKWSQRLPRPIAQVKVGNTSENVLNDKSDKSYILCMEQIWRND